MLEPKIRLSLVVPGATMLSSQECEENPKTSYNEIKMRVMDRTKGSAENIRALTRKTKPAKHSISISKEAYDHMVSSDCSGMTRVYSKSAWARMSWKERLEAHLSRIAENFSASDYTYQILDD